MEPGYILGGIMLCGGALWVLAALADLVDATFLAIPALLMIFSIFPIGMTHDKIQQRIATPIRATALKEISQDWHTVQHINDSPFDEQYTVERNIGNCKFRGVLVPERLQNWKVIKVEFNTDGRWRAFSETEMVKEK